ncbi:TauD/TfdA family dioxygenase [Actinomadura miaoliensis]
MSHRVLDSARATAAGPPRVTPVAGRIGAVVSGVRLSGDLPDGVVARIWDAVLRHRVLFFRDQHHLDPAGQVEFARRLGEPTAAHPTLPPLDGHEHVLDVGDAPGRRADEWHTDASFTDRPPKASVLRAVRVPPHGGDTVWANTAAAYDGLPVELREVADRLWALHTNRYDYVRPHATGAGRRRREPLTTVTFETEHPVVRVHPETGERALLLGGFARSVVGLSDRADSQALIRLFQEHVTRLENTVRWHWAPGDVAIWDNRATQHRVVHDFGDRPRSLHRVGLAGEAPVSVDGRRSVPRTGPAARPGLAP